MKSGSDTTVPVPCGDTDGSEACKELNTLGLLQSTIQSTTRYILRSQRFRAGYHYGAFWSEKAYHGPLLDWNGGGSHHPRGAASAGLALWMEGVKDENNDYQNRAEAAFDWLVACQHPRGGWFEIQNNEQPSDWEKTGLEELSTIESAFAIHGLGSALLKGLKPKKIYMDCLEKAGHWFLSMEWPSASGVFPHHERSPFDTLNANAHAVESLALIHACLNSIYARPINIFLQGARRGFSHTLGLQWENGCFPYRANRGVTINYTSAVLWCFLNTLDVLEPDTCIDWPEPDEVSAKFVAATQFLVSCINDDGSLNWQNNETTTAKHNIWTYAITANVLARVGGAVNLAARDRILSGLSRHRTESGLLAMRDHGPHITECLYMQADIWLFLQDAIAPGIGAENTPGSELLDRTTCLVK